MKHLSFIILIISILVFPLNVFADAKSDYEYQLAQYRKSYTEFSQLKRDYLANPTLDNQQKALIVARQALLARDLSKSSYALYLSELINAPNTSYEPFNKILTRLGEASIFFSSSAQKSQVVTTPAELKSFSAQYSRDTLIHDRSFYYGQVAAKLAQLIRFQLDMDGVLQTIYPKLPDPRPIPLKARLDEIPVKAAQINKQVADSTALITPTIEEGQLDPDYFTDFSTTLGDIRSRQLLLIDQLIDIDLNYAQL